jgi:hypothetical protein
MFRPKHVAVLIKKMVVLFWKLFSFLFLITHYGMNNLEIMGFNNEDELSTAR